jgi:hypothetical protein
VNTSEAIDLIATALAKAQGEMAPAIKDAVNPAFRSKYADLAAVWAACCPALSKHGIATVQDAELRQHPDGSLGVSVTTRLIHTSGQWIQFGPLTVPMSKQDAHGVGSATTYARRYGLSAALGIVADDDDGNAAVGNGSGAASSSKPSALPAKPKGYDEWRIALTASADNGIDTLAEAWKGVQPAFRNYFNATEKEGTLDALKAKAKQSEAVPA